MSGMLMEAVKHLSLLSLTDDAVLTYESRYESRWSPRAFTDLPPFSPLLKEAGVTLLRLKIRVMNFGVLLLALLVFVQFWRGVDTREVIEAF